jgi:hypothetical protein
MKIYKVKFHNKEREEINTFVLKDTYTTTIDSKGLLRFFARGMGYVKTKHFTEMDVDIDMDCKDALYIGKIANEYSDAVAEEVCMNAFGCCNMSATSWVRTFSRMYTIAKKNMTDEEIAKISREVCNAIRGAYWFDLVDIISLDQSLSRMDSDYDCVKATYKGKPISMKDYVALKYGELTSRFIELAIKGE